MAGLATSGTLTHWFREHFAKDLNLDSSFGELSEEANQSIPGSNGIVFLPYFSGERTPIHDPDAKGLIFGLRVDHTRGDIYRGLIEGIAFGTRHVVDTFVECSTQTNRLFAVGGGTKNELWIQSTSDITGLDQIVREKTVGASYGDAFLAALAVGIVEPRDIGKWNPAKRVLRSQSDAQLEKNYEIFKNLYIATKHLMKQI
jgi:xylulokinase